MQGLQGIPGMQIPGMGGFSIAGMPGGMMQGMPGMGGFGGMPIGIINQQQQQSAGKKDGNKDGKEEPGNPSVI